MPTMTVKEWAAEYRRNNEWEQQERLDRLPHESVEDSVRSYFALCRMSMPFALEAEKSPGLWEERMNYYILVVDRWQRLAHKLKNAAQP